MVVEVIYTSKTFRILAHEEDQYTDFLSIAVKQTKAGPRSSGNPFLVYNVFGDWASYCRVNLIKAKIQNGHVFHLRMSKN